ncbi:MAG: ABC transporter ATP-binding protein [Clostridia bacterium]|nr:ABC transporter ATP-binding protein [Clostridia bacterium]
MSQPNNRKKLNRNDNAIPDYDHLFSQNENITRKKKKGFFGKILKHNAPAITCSCLVYLLQASPLWLMPVISANIINVVTDLINGSCSTDFAIWNIIINSSILLVLLLQNVPATILRFSIVSRIVRRTGAGIKSAVVRKLQRLSITYHKDMQAGKIHSKFIKDTESVDTLLSNLLHGIIPNVITVIVATVISVYNNGFIALFFLVVIPVNVLLTNFFKKKISKVNRDYRIKTEDVSSKLNNMLEMIPVTKSHGLENVEINSINRKIINLSGSGRNVDMNTANFGSWVWVVNMILSGACLVFCAFLALNGIIKVGDIVLYQSMFTQISSSVISLTNSVPAFATGIEALSSISEIMNATDVESITGKNKVPHINGTVTFNNVSYRYPDGDQNVIDKLTLDVKQGECVAFVGSSGSGKSTVMNLIIGFMKATEGEILIDGKPIDSLNLSQYRHHISVVPQNSILFSGSIRENITYGLEKYTEEQLQKVVEMANLNEFVKDLPDGLDTQVGEHGDKLSGGQRQRITIARALIRNPKILILDEATSALDNISEFHVQRAISSSIKGRTTFIVAHRLSTIRNADRIVVMDQGVAVEIGTYDELMAKKGAFYKLKELNDINMKQAEEALA